jgi:hypothetical protein
MTTTCPTCGRELPTGCRCFTMPIQRTRHTPAWVPEAIAIPERAGNSRDGQAADLTARRNHNQTLPVLRQRGGLLIEEAVAVAMGLPYSEAVRLSRTADEAKRLAAALGWARA